jgi:hypothetical protein
MARWLRTFIRRELVADVPAEMDSCLDCGKVECEFQSCVRRKARATRHLAYDARALYEDLYCARGEAENRIGEQFELFADRASSATNSSARPEHPRPSQA